jgi:ADP-heptose:LPS heptosyltransferase
MSQTQPRVLVIRGGAIGDFILTLPAIRLLRENLATCHLEVLGYPGIVDLAVSAGLADGTRSLNDPRMALLFARGATMDAELGTYFTSFNLIVSYLYDPDAILRSNLERLGVKALIDMPQKLAHGAGHATEQLARPLQKLALFLEEPQWRLPIFPASVKTSKIAIHLGSGSESKNWPMDRWGQLIRDLQNKRPNTQIVCITGEAEEARGTVAAAEIHPSIERWHALPLVELASRLSRCSLFLGHDSGISHLASACGVPSLLLFGPTDPATWAPPQATVQILQAPEGEMAGIRLETVREAVLLLA